MVYRLGGPLGFFRGLQARVLYQMPSAAICWSTYEFFKYVLTSTVLPLPVLSEHHKSLAAVDGLQQQSQPFDENASCTSLPRLPHVDTTPRSLSSISPSKPCELPMSSPHHGVYNTLTLSRVHPTDNVTKR